MCSSSFSLAVVRYSFISPFVFSLVIVLRIYLLLFIVLCIYFFTIDLFIHLLFIYYLLFIVFLILFFYWHLLIFSFTSKDIPQRPKTINKNKKPVTRCSLKWEALIIYCCLLLLLHVLTTRLPKSAAPQLYVYKRITLQLCWKNILMQI